MVRIRESVGKVHRDARFGARTVIGDLFSRGLGRWYAVTRCDCGTIDVIDTGELTQGRSRQCKSCRGRKAKKDRYKHGFGLFNDREPLYAVWIQMRARCNCKNSKSYYRYGGRGILVCSEWDDYTVFRRWAMQSGYSPGLTIDRIDNDGNYEPGNCRWLTKSEHSKKTIEDRRKSGNIPINNRRVLK